MKYFNIYAYANVKLDNTGSVIEPELPINVEQYIDTGDSIIERTCMRDLEDFKKEHDDVIIKINTKGDVTTIKIFVIED